MLSEEPRPPGAIKLTGEDAYRVRVGDYRIIYTIQDKQLICVDHRHRTSRRRVSPAVNDVRLLLRGRLRPVNFHMVAEATNVDQIRV